MITFVSPSVIYDSHSTARPRPAPADLRRVRDCPPSV